MESKRIIRLVLIVAGILLIPIFGNIYVDGWMWDLSDFIIMGAALFGVGLAYELIARRSEKTVYRAAFAVGLLGAFLLFWVNGAVGIIGSEDNPMNLLYGAVFVVGLVGSLLTRFKQRGMSLTLFAAALTTFMVPITAYIINRPDFSPGVVGVLTLNFFFVLLFALSGLLFRRAAS